MFANRVFPGAALVRATRWRTSALIRLDLPTFERPTIAISARLSRGKSVAPAALRTKLASILKGLEGRDARKRLDGVRSVLPSLPLPFLPSCPLMSNGVVHDVDRLGLRCSRQTTCQRLRQRDLQDFVHRLDH